MNLYIKGENVMMLGEPCRYITPCGWCWKCDSKVGLASDKPQPPCLHCDSYEYGDPKCPTCKKENYKYFKEKV